MNTVFILKLILVFLSAMFMALDVFIFGEYLKFRKSENIQSTTLFEKLLINAIAFICIALITAMAAYLIILLFSTIQIQLPW